jgi:DNA-binding transcriptional ArsR family regulator
MNGKEPPTLMKVKASMLVATATWASMPRAIITGTVIRDVLPVTTLTTLVRKNTTIKVAKFADMLSAMGTEPRLRIMQLLLSAHPDGLVVGDIQSELDIPNSTLSHHLEKLKNEELVNVRRESTFLRYTANTEALQELLQFLYAECCTRNKAVKPQNIVQLCK